MANIAFRSQTNAYDASFGASTIASTLPTGTVSGDLMIMWAGAGSVAPTAAPTYTTPSGWTSAGSATGTLAGSVINFRLYLFYKVAGGSEGTVTLTASSNALMLVGRLSYQNADITTQFGQVTFGSAGASTSAVVSDLTIARVNSMRIDFIGQGAPQNITPPGTMTERIDNANGFSVHDAIIAATGATGTRTYTLPTSADKVFATAEFYSAMQGTLSSTLGAATLSATGTIALAGTLTKTLANATLSATGALDNNGALAKTLADATLSSTGALAIVGTLTKTLDDATLVADGIGATAIEGVLSATLDDATLSATGQLALQGTLAKTLDAATLSSAGVLTISGTASPTLADATLSATGTVALAGALSKTLADATLAATGAVALAGTLTQTLDDATLVAAGAGGATGELTATLADATLIAAGILTGDATPVATGGGKGGRRRRRIVFRDRVYDVDERDIPAFLEAMLVKPEAVNRQPVEKKSNARRVTVGSLPKIASVPEITLERAVTRYERARSEIQAEQDVSRMLDEIAGRMIQQLQDDEDAAMLLLA